MDLCHSPNFIKMYLFVSFRFVIMHFFLNSFLKMSILHFSKIYTHQNAQFYSFLYSEHFIEGFVHVSFTCFYFNLHFIQVSVFICIFKCRFLNEFISISAALTYSKIYRFISIHIQFLQKGLFIYQPAVCLFFNI